MEMNNNTTLQEVKNGSLVSENMACESHPTIKMREESEVMSIISESLKKEEEYRTNGVCQQQEGNCFDMALKGSKRFLEAQGNVLKKTLNSQKK